LTPGDTSSGDVRLRVCAVSYLNTVPLIRGFTDGPQRGVFDLSFKVPSALAGDLEAGRADVGLLPCAELDRLGVDHLEDLGIACRGPVRSILLVSRVEPARIRSLAVDASSRSSVMLTRIVLAERYGVRPQLFVRRPDLGEMLQEADAALLIGDPALRVDPAKLPWHVLDLGEEWCSLTGLPMVFAVWAGARRHLTPAVADAFVQSYRYGMSRLDDIVAEAPSLHGVSQELARTYLTEHIKFELNSEDRRGIALYRRKVAELRELDLAPVESL
jgi:predicted solute-binding protein